MSGRTEGRLLVIGGNEEKEGECRILRSFVEMAGGRDARLVILTTATELPEEVGEEDREITEIVTDSRRVTAGSLFVCIRGLRTDGHAHVGEALERGAACVLTLAGEQPNLPAEVPLMTCEDTRRISFFFFVFFRYSPSGSCV